MSDQFNLPQDLGEGLVLRWATPDDTKALAEFNVRIHSDNPEKPETWLAHWTEDLMRGDHPTTTASDFTVVVDENAGGKIVSSMNLISQTWLYDGIPFGVGRPELVGTDANYRRRGLVREQFTAVHAKSAARGELVQAITGIPWYYRMFGYGMALDLGGGRDFLWDRPGNDKPVEEEPYRLRPAAEADWPLLQTLYEAHNRGSLLSRARDEASWRYELTIPHPDSMYSRSFYVVETAASSPQPAAYVEYKQFGKSYYVRELGVAPGHSWRAVGLFLMRYLKKQAEALKEKEDKQLRGVFFGLSQGHPVYEALGSQLEEQRRPYAWYIRVPDLPAFLHHIAPALEKRLAESVLSGHSGTTRVNLYQQQFTLVFANGQLKEVGTYQPKVVEDGDIHFPGSTILQLIFGHASLDALNTVHPDCFTRDTEAAVLFKILFPKRPSWVVPMG
ncbi:MAG: GNAT family N-acetyltransferase [Anaerolineaceae bacterium]|nr:GNAT family N-acetyltransferase [Anaerolineaceae bacterium]